MTRLAAAVVARVGARVRTVREEIAYQELIVAAYLAILAGALIVARGAGWQRELAGVAADALVLFVGIAVGRTGAARSGGGLALLHRALVFAPIVLSYLQLRGILPAVRSASFDAELLAFDRAVFGIEPAVDWQPFVRPWLTEWFAFFYWSYFPIVAVSVLAFVCGVSDDAAFGRFSSGMLVVYCTAHLLYMVVPGHGPYRHLADELHVPLEGGAFWSSVRAIVDAAGAQKDIFPSLHTAAPAFIALFAFRHRRESSVLARAWLPLAFATSQIVIATMYLRWHWLIDVVAGMVLACVAVFVGERLHEKQRRHREARALGPAFAPLPWGARATESRERDRWELPLASCVRRRAGRRARRRQSRTRDG
ncbi:MAG: phosphatase PAP2 family protein [Deltaproteobacteria bacterium]|nr:phosphatase PAP2 family protein [Deltaproteobacteria bacterium]